MAVLWLQRSSNEAPTKVDPVDSGTSSNTNRHLAIRERPGVQIALVEPLCEQLERGVHGGLGHLGPWREQQPLRLAHVRGDRICGVPKAGILIEADDGQMSILNGQPHRCCREHRVPPELVGCACHQACVSSRPEPPAALRDLDVALTVILPLREGLGVLGLDPNQAGNPVCTGWRHQTQCDR